MVPREHDGMTSQMGFSLLRPMFYQFRGHDATTTGRASL
jgi:hypothetical protein